MGTVGEHGKWMGIIGELIQKEFDAIVSSVDYTAERTHAIDHLYPIIYSWRQIFFKSDGDQLQWLSVLNPFTTEVWMVLSFWIVIWAIVYKAACVISFHQDMEAGNRPSLIDCCFTVLQAICSQGSRSEHKVWACRLIFIISYLVSAVILPSYSASLISSLTIHVPQKPVDNLKELLAANKFILVGKRSASYEYFANYGNDSVRKAIFENSVKLSTSNKEVSLQKCFDEACQNSRNTVSGTEIEVNQRIKLPRGCEIVKFSQPLGKIMQSIVLAKHSPYTELFNYYLLKMAERGIIKKHIKFFIKPSSSEPLETHNPVALLDVTQIFLFYLVATAVSGLVLLWETLRSGATNSIV